MRRLASILCIFICVVVSGCSHASPPVPRMQRSTPSASEIAIHLQLWMSPESARQIVKSMRPGPQPRDEEITSGPTEVRYVTGPEEYLVLRFNTLRDPNGPMREQLTGIYVCRFEDLKSPANAEVFPYLRLIHRAPSAEGFEFNPLSLIQAVNGLIPLGKQGALAALREYESLCHTGNSFRQSRYDLDEQRIFLIARLLFVRTDHDPRMPVMAIGGTDLDSLRNSREWPLFPLVLQDDVPFFMVGGFNLGGVPQSPTDHLDYCQDHCTLRDCPLTPTTSPPLAAEALLASNAWQALFAQTDQFGRFQTQTLIRNQALCAIDYLLPEPETKLNNDPEAADRFWKQTHADLRRWPAAWNAVDQRFH